MNVRLFSIFLFFFSQMGFAMEERFLFPPVEPMRSDAFSKDPMPQLVGEVGGSVLDATVGGESRVVLNNDAYPYSTTGRIIGGSEEKWVCTGTLIGPRHVLTNSHCVDPKQPIYFYPSYQNGKYRDAKEQRGSYGIYVYQGTGADYNDWAVVILHDRLGDEFGYLGTRSFNKDWYDKAWWTMVSYPVIDLNSKGKYPLYESGCKIKSMRSGSLLHTCDVQGGASGSAIFATWEKETYVVALNWGSRGTDCNYSWLFCHNLAVESDRFSGAVSKAREEYK